MCFWRLCHKRHDRWVLDLVVELTGRVPKSHTIPDDVTCILADVLMAQVAESRPPI